MTWQVLELEPKDFNADISAPSLPDSMVNDISNIDFYSGVARTLSDLTSITVPLQIPYAIQAYSDDTSSYAAYCGTSGVYSWGSAGHVNITPASGLTGSTYWDVDNFGRWLVVTNDKVGEVPHGISTTLTASGGKLAPLPGWQSAWECTVIKKHRNVLFAFNTIESGVAYPNRVRWSASSPADTLPSTWVPAPSNDAGQTDLEIGGGQIYDACAVGDIMYIGGGGGLWAARWVGGQYVYKFSQVSGEIGPRGLRCMVAVGDAVAVLTVNDLLIMSENMQQSIVIGRVATLIRQFQTSELLYVSTLRQLYVFYSLVNETGYQHALIYDVDSKTWGKRDFPSTPFTAVAPIIIPVANTQPIWDSDNTVWDADSTFWELPTSVQVSYIGANGSGIYSSQGKSYNWFLSKTLMPAPNNDNIRVRAIEIDADGISGQKIIMRVGSSIFPSQAPIWGQQRTYTLGENLPMRHDDIHQGRFISWQLSGNGSVKINKVRIFYNARDTKP